jgi:hypothetical protein
MNGKAVLVNVGKLILCAILFSLGMIVGGMVVTLLGMQSPPMPEGMNPESAMLLLLVESPLLALVLALLARYLSGGFWARTWMLFLLSWIANSLNNQIEAAAFAGMDTGFWYTVITFLFPILATSMGVAWLFPPADRRSFPDAVRSFFAQYTAGGWLWRLALAAISFMPIYYLFGLLVIPFTRAYYEQNLYGLEIPSLDRLITILFVRSLLFFVATLPIVIAWQNSRWSLAWRLGLALFYLVGFQSLLIANWMPWSLRLPHMIEILFDEFVYAGVLVLLLRTRNEETLTWRVRASSPERHG